MCRGLQAPHAEQTDLLSPAILMIAGDFQLVMTAARASISPSDNAVRRRALL
jgi:hypothetical protein